MSEVPLHVSLPPPLLHRTACLHSTAHQLTRPAVCAKLRRSALLSSFSAHSRLFCIPPFPPFSPFLPPSPPIPAPHRFPRFLPIPALPLRCSASSCPPGIPLRPLPEVVIRGSGNLCIQPGSHGDNAGKSRVGILGATPCSLRGLRGRGVGGAGERPEKRDRRSWGDDSRQALDSLPRILG